MPELDFVLPHWAYWGGLLLFPLAAFILYRRSRSRPRGKPVTLTLGYFFLLSGGFIGVHRLYLKSRWAAAFVLVFIAILIVNVEARLAREVHSNAVNAVTLDESRLARAEKALRKAEERVQRQDNARNRDKVTEALTKIEETEARLVQDREAESATRQTHERWNQWARWLGLLLLAGILADAILMPSLVRRRNAIEGVLPAAPGFQCPVVEQEHDDSKEPFAFNRVVSRVNAVAGELVAYWSIIAVFAYYYEVIARYVFNSPTNWAHEGMFLMFGMQYLIAGGFCLRENAHVRVDVIYSQLPRRTQAIMDLVTSVFFFIFVMTLLVTGWIFFSDAFEIREVSFTEWAVQYWPVKFALPLGAFLLLVQGISQLVKDIAAVMQPDAVFLDTETRPEG